MARPLDEKCPDGKKDSVPVLVRLLVVALIWWLPMPFLVFAENMPDMHGQERNPLMCWVLGWSLFFFRFLYTLGIFPGAAVGFGMGLWSFVLVAFARPKRVFWIRAFILAAMAAWAFIQIVWFDPSGFKATY